MIDKKHSKKLVLIASLFCIVVYSGAPKILSASQGLPYHHFWDEPQSVSGALKAMKLNRVIPHDRNYLVYGGALRNPMILIDYIYYGYLKISPKYDVESKSDIITFIDGPVKTTSHSGFYYWNRIYIILINVLAFVFLFEIGRLRGGYAFGFISVIILASIWRYYETSFTANVDVPLSTWTLGAILFALQFNKNKNKRNLYYSLICVGLAGSTKYTGALTLIIPITSVLLNIKVFEWKSAKDVVISFLIWGCISLGVFVIFNPIIIFNAKRFFNTLEWISMTYKTGQGHFEKVPGIEHLTYQLGELIKNFGTFFIYLSLAGLIIGFIRFAYKKYWQDGTNAELVILTLFPVFYLIYITFFYSIAYHRNFILIYPILAILSAETIFSFLKLLYNRFQSMLNKRVLFDAMAIVIFFTLSFPGYSNILKNGIKAYKSIETRSRSVLEINQMAEKDSEIFLGICNDLLISSEDLRKLKVDYGFYDITLLDSAIMGFTHLLIPEYESNGQIENFESLKASVNNNIQERELARINGNRMVIEKNLNELSRPIVNPAVIILKGEDYPPPLMKRFRLTLKFIQSTVLPSNTPVEILSKKLLPGNYKIRFECRGREANGEYPIFKILLDSDTIGTFITQENYIKNEATFSISRESRYRIYYKMTNDLYDVEKGFDRNTFIKNTEIWKTD